MNYEIVHLDEKIVAGCCARTSNTAPDMGQVIGGLWQKFYSPDGHPAIPGRIGDKALGIYTDYADAEKGEYTVMVACEVSGADVPGFFVRKIPAGTYAKFIVKGHTVTAVQQFWQELWQMKLNRSFVCDFEEYQNADFENAEIHIYIGLQQ
ncbi:GyrI-like domain-containing protein [uncultured Ruminococcus sp.]|uniref:GyrI-like domain-containing protein n=1 Tax=uncultured Ruminococcus sp. TaxID=165186 RepID=UPI0026055214|nr:GyrI-like domain-containing protein [uncultured Ruminococcus sp.]